MIDPTLHERILRKIRTKDRFESELRREFGGEPGFEASLKRLRSQGIVDDRRSAEALVRAKSPASRAQLEALLREKGVDPAPLLTGHDDLAAAREIVSRRAGDPPARVARYLASRGFEPDLVEAVLRGG